MDLDQEQSDLSPRCLPVCKNRFEKFARIFSRQHKQTTFSDAGFLGALRANISLSITAVPFYMHVERRIIIMSSRPSMLVCLSGLVECTSDW